MSYYPQINTNSIIIYDGQNPVSRIYSENNELIITNYNSEGGGNGATGSIGPTGPTGSGGSGTVNVRGTNFGDYLYWGNTGGTGAWVVGSNRVRIGGNAGETGMGNYSIAIGRYAGQINQPANSIILNATGQTGVNGSTGNALYIKPIRNELSGVTGTLVLTHNPISGEVISRDLGFGVGVTGIDGATQYYTLANQDIIPSVNGITGTQGFNLGSSGAYFKSLYVRDTYKINKTDYILNPDTGQTMKISYDTVSLSSTITNGAATVNSVNTSQTITGQIDPSLLPLNGLTFGAGFNPNTYKTQTGTTNFNAQTSYMAYTLHTDVISAPYTPPSSPPTQKTNSVFNTICGSYYIVSGLGEGATGALTFNTLKFSTDIPSSSPSRTTVNNFTSTGTFSSPVTFNLKDGDIMILAGNLIPNGSFCDFALQWSYVQFRIPIPGVTTANLQDLCVTSQKISDGAIVASKLAPGAVSADNLADNSVTYPKLSTDVQELLTKGYTGGIGINVDDTDILKPVINNTGVIGITAGDNVTVSTVGQGVYQISATGGGGGSGGTGPTGPQGPTGPGGLAGVTGGTGIQVTSSGDSAVITNIANQTYIDNWFFRNVASKPPGPTGPIIQVIQTNSEIGFSLVNPTLTPFGPFMAPYINSITYKVDPTPSAVNPLYILNNNSTYLPSTNPIQAFVLNRINNTSSYGNRTFSSGTFPTYTFGNTGLNDYINNNQVNVTLWFDNTNVTTGTVNSITVPLAAFLTAFPPSAPRNLNSSFVGEQNAVINWTVPQYTSYDPSGNTGDNNSSISEYLVLYNYINSPQRYGNNTSQSNSINTGNTNYSLTGLYPGSNYNVNVAAKNTIPGTSWGQTGPGTTILTSLPSAPSYLNSSDSFTLPASDYNSNVKLVSDGSIVTYPIYFKTNSVKNGTSKSFNILSGPGDTGASTYVFTMSVNGNSNNFNQSTYRGFGYSPNFIGVTGTQNIFTLNNIVTDFYSSSSVPFQNFYLQTALTPGLNPNTVTPGVLTQVNSSGQVNGGSLVNLIPSYFYTDILNGPPSITAFTLTNLTPVYITGIPVIGNTSFAPLTYSLFSSDIGKYFYRSDKIADFEFTNSGVGNVNNNIITTLPSGVSEPLLSVNYINQQFGVQFLPNSFNINGVSFTVTVYNYMTSSNSVSTTTNLGQILDAASYNKSFTGSIPSLAGTGFIQGCQQVSLVNTQYNNNPSPYTQTTTNFNNSSSISSTYDLPILQGLYSTSFNNNAYLTAAGYSGLINSNFRYATFSWNIPPSYSGLISTLFFQYNNWNSNGLVSRNNLSSSIESSAYVAYYRFTQYDGSGPLVPNSSNYSTYWINANSFNDPNFSSRYYDPQYNGSLGGLIYSESDTGNTNNPASSSFTYKLLMKSFIPTIIGFTQMRVDFVVGLQMNQNISFDTVNCNFS